MPAFVVLLVLAVLGGLFVGSFSSALGDPHPHDVPIAAVGSSAHSVEAAFDISTPDAVSVVRYSDVSAARLAIDRQTVFAALELTDRARPVLMISTASGPSVATVMRRCAPALQGPLDLVRPVQVVDLHPVSSRDPSSTVFFYVALAVVVMGFVGAVQTSSNAKTLSLRGQIGWGLARGITVGFVVWATVDPLLQMQPLPLAAVWPLLTWTSWTTATTYLLFRLLVGSTWAMVPTWVLFIVVGNPGSGGPVADPLLPHSLAAIGRLMPAGATISALRDLTYFPDFLQPGPFAALAIWGVATTCGWLLLRAHRVRHPGSGVAPA